MLPTSGDALYDSALEPLGRYLTKKNLMELRANKAGEVLLVYVKQPRDGQAAREEKETLKAPELTLAFWESLCHTLANKRGLRFDPVEEPTVSVQLPGGHRFEAMMGKTVDTGIGVVIRMKRSVPVELEDFGLEGEHLERVIAAVERGANVIISGGTASGKTTLFNALIRRIPADRRLYVLEDTKELEVPHHDVTRRILSRTETGGGAGYGTAFDNAMRSTPDQVLLGELSLANTFAAVVLLNSGHKGFAATVHAESPTSALDFKFHQNLVMGGRANLPREDVSSFLRDTVDLVIQVTRTRTAARRITHLWWVAEGAPLVLCDDDQGLALGEAA